MNKNVLIAILIIAVLGLAGYVALPYLQPKEPTVGEKVGQAIDGAADALSKGAEDAAKAIEGK